jgi:hypothetical protein
VDGALIGDLQQLGALLASERSSQLNDALNAIEHHRFGFAFGAIFGVDTRMPQPNRNAFERPRIAPRIHSERHGSAGAERREK